MEYLAYNPYLLCFRTTGMYTVTDVSLIISKTNYKTSRFLQDMEHSNYGIFFEGELVGNWGP